MEDQELLNVIGRLSLQWNGINGAVQSINTLMAGTKTEIENVIKVSVQLIEEKNKKIAELEAKIKEQEVKL